MIGAYCAMIGLTCAVALAQPTQTAGPVSLGPLFVDDNTELRPGAEQKLREAAARAVTQDGCPLMAKFTVTVPGGDPIFQAAVAGAQRDVIKAVLETMPVRTEVKDQVGGKGGKYDVEVRYDRATDMYPPKLHTSSVPPKGSKVRPGTQIKVTMTARDDATRTETGIQSIQLFVEGTAGNERIGGQDYRPVIRANCEGRPEARTLEVTYTVPPNPPPVVRLLAIAEDFANHTDIDRGEFPTQGDWYGRIEWFFHSKPQGGNETKYDGHADLTVTNDGRGNLTGTLLGSQKVDIVTWGDSNKPIIRCRGSAPWTPVRARVLGSDTPGRNALSLQLVDVEARIDVRWDCPNPTPIDSGPSLSGLLHALQPAGGGMYRAELKSTDPIHTWGYSLTLWPVTH